MTLQPRIIKCESCGKNRRAETAIGFCIDCVIGGFKGLDWKPGMKIVRSSTGMNSARLVGNAEPNGDILVIDGDHRIWQTNIVRERWIPDLADPCTQGAIIDYLIGNDTEARAGMKHALKQALEGGFKFEHLQFTRVREPRKASAFIIPEDGGETFTSVSEDCSEPWSEVALGRGIKAETAKAYLCTENIWWPKSHARLRNGKLFVSRWIHAKKLGEDNFGEDGRDLEHDGVQGVDWGFYDWGDS